MAIKHLEQLKDKDYFKGENSSCVVREMHDAPSNNVIAMHGHEFSELVIVASGSLNHIHASGTSRLASGDFFVIHPGERHGYAELAAGTIVFNILYHRDRPPPALAFGEFPLMALFFPSDPNQVKARTIGCLSRQELPRVVNLVKAIRRESENNRPLRDIICASLFSAILLHLSRARNTDAAISSNPIQRELDFIRGNLDHKVTLKELCAVSGRSVSTLSRAFRKATGKSPYDFMIAMRVTKARTLMDGPGNISLAEAARRTGFCSSGHLSRTLRVRHAIRT